MLKTGLVKARRSGPSLTSLILVQLPHVKVRKDMENFSNLLEPLQLRPEPRSPVMVARLANKNLFFQHKCIKYYIGYSCNKTDLLFI